MKGGEFKIEDYFGGMVIGSMLLERAKLIPIEMVNDIDIMVKKENLMSVKKYLRDNGYEEGGKYETYDRTPRPNQAFSKEGFKVVHLVVNHEKVWSISTLIGQKFKRGHDSDLNQIIESCKSLIKQSNQKP